MSTRGLALVAIAGLVIGMVGALLIITRSGDGDGGGPASLAGALGGTAEADTRTIKARLFYVSEAGTHLTSVERDVPFAEGIEQARQIVVAQLGPAPAPLVSPIPAGTTLRGLYITDRGEAYVDLSEAVASAHPGGTLNELLTVYAIVEALTVNLPAVRSVQILVDGREVATLAGHVDLRQPLTGNAALVQ